MFEELLRLWIMADGGEKWSIMINLLQLIFSIFI